MVLAVATVAADLESVKFYGGLAHEGDLSRQIDVRTHVEEVMVSTKVKNVGKESTGFLLIAVASEVASSLAFVQAASDGNGGRELKTTQVTVTGLDAAPKGTVFYKAGTSAVFVL
jgi:hypothetical protein